MSVLVSRVLRCSGWRGAASAAYSTAGEGGSPPPGAPVPPVPASPSSSSAPPSPPLPPNTPNLSRRFSSSIAPKIDNKTFLWSRYGEMKRLVQDLLPPGVCNLLNSSTIYANNEVCFGDIEVYGFDYDYTLALYSEALHSMIFNTARDILVEQYKYPAAILKYDYLPNFAVRGLHYDINKGLLMKIDAYHYIELGTVYRGLKPVPNEEVLELYQGTHHIPLHQVSGFYGKGPAVKQYMDIFSLPEMTLLAVVNDFFISNDIDYDPVHLYKDVTDAIRDVHVKGFMYKWIMADLEKYILRGEETYAVLQRLASQGKKLFLITNSPFSFVDKGMKYMVGQDWRDFFDVVIVQADKPNFFNDCIKPFRRVDGNGDLKWDRITKLEKGQVYKQGNLFDFLRLTGWRGSRVLYFGDHLYSDLADLMLRHGWRTGAIVPELESETRIVNTEQYSQSLTWMQALTGLLERMQNFRDPESQQILQDWMRERHELRDEQWGSTPPIPQQCRMSQELWMWAKCQVLSTLRMPFGIRATLPVLKKAAAKEGSCDSITLLPKAMVPYKPDNALKSSRTHQELHRELLVTYKKGLVLHSKPELLRVLEKRRNQQEESKDTKVPHCPLQQELQKWQLRREERQQEATKSEEPAPGVHEFLKVRENLRKSKTRDVQSPPPPVS